MRWITPVLFGLTQACGGATDTSLIDAASDSASGNDGSPNTDASSDGASLDAIVEGGGPATLPCGTVTCTGGQSCCVDTSTATTTYTCASVCPKGTDSLKCNGNDCGSLVCCLYLLNNQDPASQCRLSCTGQNVAQLCQDVDGGPTGCSSTAPCSSAKITDWNLTPPYGTCGGVGN